jgi:hypothetical protein
MVVQRDLLRIESLSAGVRRPGGGEPFRSTYCREKTQIGDTVGQIEEAFGGHRVTDGHAQ